MQYLDISLYPASFKQPTSAFTFELLDKFHMLKVHSHMSTDQFNSLLRRFTNSMFPDTALVRPISRFVIAYNLILALHPGRTDAVNSLAFGFNGIT